MTDLEIINDKLEELNDLKDFIIQIILDTDELSKIQKLAIITNNNLWGIDPYITDFSDDWEEECYQEERRLALKSGVTDEDHICSYSDCPFIDDKTGRGSTVYFTEILESVKYHEKDDGKILVATSRGKFNAKIYKSYEEIVNHIYEHAIGNRIIGFNFDW